MCDICPENNKEIDQEHMEMVSLTSNGQAPTLPSAVNESHKLMVNEDVPPQPNTDKKVTCLLQIPQHKLGFLPILTCVVVLCAFLICYLIAVRQGHVEWDFPYISHTALEAPERCIFAQLVNIGALLLAINVYVRYKQTEVYLVFLNSISRDKRINRAAEIIGFISAFGLSIVANFQTREMREVHYTGAFLAFVLGTVYCWLQTSLSIKNSRYNRVTYFQIAISIILTICLIVFIASKTIYRLREKFGHGTRHDILREVYLASTISEWLTALSVISFVLTYYRDFSNISMKLGSVKICNENLITQQHHGDTRQNNSIFL